MRPAPAHGFVDVFDLSGGSMKRLISQGELNSPWGLQIAPSSFGSFAGDLLVGNFGDGTIDAYNKDTGAFIDVLRRDRRQSALHHATFGASRSAAASADGGDVNSVFFTAGLEDEGHGLFGSLTAVPEPSTWAMTLIGFAVLAYSAYRRGARLQVG